MATDIAFALAIVYLLGDKVPLSAKVFLTTLAIVDDLGSVIVIALFYTSNISIPSILVGVDFFLVSCSLATRWASNMPFSMVSLACAVYG